MERVLQQNDDWQSRRSIIECNRRMWTDQLGCDVTFIIGHGALETRIQAHKYVLCSRSCVFYAMFIGPLSGNTGREIRIPDMMPEQFNDLLQFLYTDELKVDLNNVLPTLYAAKKYCVQSLIDKCLNTLKKNMVPENVCTVMENAHIYGNNELMKKCFDLVVQETERVFKAEDLAELCIECFISIVKEDSIPVTEETVFDAVLKYAKGKCERNDQNVTPETMKAVVADVIPHIRFPLMKDDFVENVVEKSGLLGDKQLKTLYRYLLRKRSTENAECEGFNGKKRKAIYTVQRFMEVGSGWGYKRDKCDAITFTSSKDILIKGFQIYGAAQGPGNLEIGVHLKQEPYKANVAIKHASVETDGKQKIYNIYFDNLVGIKKHKKYTFTLVVKGPSTYYGTKGEHQVVRDDIEFVFEKSELSTNNTNEDRGQIPGIVYEFPPEAELPQQAEGTQRMETQFQ